jgi:hypothetical protein
VLHKRAYTLAHDLAFGLLHGWDGERGDEWAAMYWYGMAAKNPVAQILRQLARRLSSAWLSSSGISMSPVVNKGNKKKAGFEDFIRIKPVLRASAALLIAFIVAEATGLESFIAGEGELALLIPACFLFLAKPAWRVLANTYEKRRNRISAVHGFIAIDSIDVSIDRIITVEYKQSVVGRLLGFGNDYTSSAAQDKPDIVMRDIVHPKGIRDGIRSILKEMGGDQLPRPKGPSLREQAGLTRESGSQPAAFATGR